MCISKDAMWNSKTVIVRGEFCEYVLFLREKFDPRLGSVNKDIRGSPPINVST